MDIRALYDEKLTTPEEAVSSIASGSHLSMGMFAAEPPALLKALADRATRGILAIYAFTILKRPKLPVILFCAMS